MNLNYQEANNATPRFTHSCKTTYQGSGAPVVNSYKCAQQQFSASEMWRINRDKKSVSIRTSIF